ncbi:FecR family protein [Sulfurimonas sp. C5]|uniref:FecR family protein n=1 Tax=Sulfurimonas sp. C5 TaxID=3036947 RepID=UPI00245579D1|nr:FecR family protein [Sulfurimonas sp. C5]
MLIIASCTYIYASVIGTVEELQGNVKVKPQNSIKKIKVLAGYQIQEGDILSTYEDGCAKIKLEDNSTLIVDTDSMVRFISGVDLKQENGKVYYKITSKKTKDALKVETNFAIIGIKGTTFIVKADEQKELLLQEGVVGINSIKEEFELYRKKINAEFEDFKAKQQQGFDEYKAAFEKYEKAVKTQAFDLQQQNKVSFEDNIVKEDSFDQNDADEFKYFEKLFDKN